MESGNACGYKTTGAAINIQLCVTDSVRISQKHGHGIPEECAMAAWVLHEQLGECFRAFAWWFATSEYPTHDAKWLMHGPSEFHAVKLVFGPRCTYETEMGSLALQKDKSAHAHLMQRCDHLQRELHDLRTEHHQANERILDNIHSLKELVMDKEESQYDANRLVNERPGIARWHLG